jgi:Tol biopolymer transport system component
MGADGSGITRLTDNEFGDFYPCLSPDGQSIFFARQIRGSNYEIFRMDTDGSNATQLTSNGAENYAPALSPDGARIVFTSTQGGSAQQIWVMGGDGLNAVQLTTEGENIDPSWSPDGRFITFASSRTGKRQLWLMNVEDALQGTDGSDQTRLTYNPLFDGNPSWSPDGQWIVFASFRESDWDIYLMPAPGSLASATTEPEVTRLTSNQEFEWAPAWSPGGTQIAFYSYRDGNGEIYVMNTDGSGQTRLTDNPAEDSSPAWSPDGRQIAFTSNRDGNFEIYVMNVADPLQGTDGSDLVRLTHTRANDYEPTWQP